MLVRNISTGVINLKSGIVPAGKTGDCNAVEFDLLMSNNRIEVVREPEPATKSTAKRKASQAKSDG